ncbi:MAG TPA: ABC transporter permease [Acidimicrobiales bacterium]|nr:ABC transporter permease [Acidimicrobiales bacterium]
MTGIVGLGPDPLHLGSRRSSRLDEMVDDQRVRRGATWVAAALGFYWLIDRLWYPPTGVILKGAVIGGLYALIALGVALIYRANNIINFAQGDLGGAPASLAVMLIAVSGWPYPAAILIGLAAGAVLGALVEFGLIRRFSKHPRLVLTVVTIGIATILQFIEIALPNLFHSTAPPQSFPSPFNFHFNVGAVRFQGNDLLAMAMIPVVIAALAWFLNRTHIGVAVRACAQSADRASLLGVPVKRVNLVVWVVASLLATVAIILRAGVVGLPIGTPLGLSILLISLAAAAIGRMQNMPTIAGASILLGVVEQSAVWHTGSSDTVDLVLFIVIFVALLAQRGGLLNRAEAAAMSTWTALREVRPIPPELVRLPAVVWTRRALIGLVGLIALFLPPLLGVARTDLASFLCAYLIIGLSLLVLAGWAGQISLGQFVFVGVGSTTGAWMTLHWHVDIVLEMLLAGLAGAVIAFILGIPALRIQGLFLGVATLAASFGFNFYLLSSGHFSWIPGPFTSIPRLPLFGRVAIDTEDRYYYLSLAVLLLAIFAVRGLRQSRAGRILMAVRENERGAQAYGVNAVRAKLMAFAISGFLAGVAGVLIVGQQGYLYAGSADPQSSIVVFISVVIGGLGSMTGVFAGAIYVEGLSWFHNLAPQAIRGVLQLLGTGVGLVFILMFLPGGVGSAIYMVRDRLLRELAARRGIIVPSLVADASAADGGGQGPAAEAPAPLVEAGFRPPGSANGTSGSEPALAQAGRFATGQGEGE